METDASLIEALASDESFVELVASLPEVTSKNRSEVMGHLYRENPFFHSRACYLAETDCREKLDNAERELQQVKIDRTLRVDELAKEVKGDIEQLRRLSRPRPGKADKVAAAQNDLKRLERSTKVDDLDRSFQKRENELEERLISLGEFQASAESKSLDPSTIDDDITLYLCEKIYKPALDNLKQGVRQELAVLRLDVVNARKRYQLLKQVAFISTGLLVLMVGTIAYRMATKKAPEKPAVVAAVEIATEKPEVEEVPRRPELALATELPLGYEEIIKKTPVIYLMGMRMVEYKKPFADGFMDNPQARPRDLVAGEVTFITDRGAVFVPLVNQPETYFDGIPDVIYSPGVNMSNPGGIRNPRGMRVLEEAMGTLKLKKFYYDIALTPGGVRFQALEKLPIPETHWNLKLDVNKQLEGLHDIVYTVNGRDYPAEPGKTLVLDLEFRPDGFKFRAKYGAVEIDLYQSIGTPRRPKKK